MVKIKFINSIPKRVILNLGGNETIDYSNKLAKDLDITYSHLTKCIKELENMKIINVAEKIGRRKKLTLTEKGEEIKKLLLKLKEFDE